MSEHVECSVLVPVLNEERHLPAMLATMRAQRFEGRLQFVLADGGSTDGTLPLLHDAAREDPRIELYANRAGGLASGLNVALGAARGDWVARMDAHTLYPVGYLADGVARLQAGGTRWVSGPQRPVGHNRVSRAFAAALSSPLGRGGSGRWDSPGGRERELDSGVFGGVWRRSTLLEYGGWDERWQRNEDSELAARFLRNGERLVSVPSMAAEYLPRGTLPDLFAQYRDYGRFRARTARRHPQSLRRSHLLPPALVAGAALATTPGTVGTLARRAAALYAGSLTAEAVRAHARGASARDAALLAAVLATMHSAHGIGLLAGAAEGGVPWAALASVCGLERVRELLEPQPELVWAPSLATHPRASAVRLP